ncbi:MAG: RIP metalloprotease RseP, partial [Gammaproteobacteria bacterium]
MLSFLWIVFTFIFALTLLISFHEFGHFIVARAFGVKVLRFSIGFGKPLLSHKAKSGTEYVIAAIPLGGYVKMLDETEGPVSDEELPQAFNRKSVWARIAIVLAGPLFNVIFAILAYLFVFMYGITSLIPMIGEISPHSVASQAHVPKNTQIVAINQYPVHDWQEVNLSLVKYFGISKTVELTLKNPKTNEENLYTLYLEGTEYKTTGPSPIQSIGIIPYQPPVPPVIDKVFPYGPAEEGGLQPGDKILTINEQKIPDWN